MAKIKSLIIGIVFTNRQKEATELYIKGATYDQIAEEMGIKRKTVENHIAKIKAKLGCSNKSRYHLVQKLIRMELLVITLTRILHDKQKRRDGFLL